MHETSASTRPTLLLVDDEEGILASLKRLLRREAYEVVTANGGRAGLEELARHPIDVIVSDQRMPGMSGVEFLRRAKELYPDTVRMVLSGYADLQSITDAINEGAIYKFLAKPWDDDMLKAEIEEAFRRKALRDENQHLGRQLLAANQELIRVNARLADALAVQTQRSELGEAALVAAQKIVNCLPVPLLGVDLDGLLVLANTEATQCFARHPLLGALVSEAMPAEVAALVAAGGGEATMTIDGRVYRVACHTLDPVMPRQGYLLIFIPREKS